LRPTVSFFTKQYTGSIQFDVQDGHGLADDQRQIQLHGTIDLGLLASRNICADGFSHAFHRFGGEFQAGQPFDLLTAVVEGDVLSHQRLQAPHAGDNSVSAISRS